MGKKVALSVFGVLLLILAVAAGVYLVGQRQLLKQEAAPATTLKLTPRDSTPSVGEEFSVAVDIDTGGNQVVGVQMSITFDAQRLEAIGATASITQTSFFDNPQSIGPTINNTAGTIEYTVHIPPENEPGVGTGTLAILTFKGKAAGNAVIALTNDTLVGSTGENGQNSLIGTTPATVQVIDASPTSTPTQTTSPTATPTPEATSTATPTTAANKGGVTTPSPSPTIPADLPVTGFSAPVLVLIALSLLLIPAGIVLMR